MRRKETMDKETRDEIARIDANIAALGSSVDQKKQHLEHQKDNMQRLNAKVAAFLNEVRQELNHLNGRVGGVAAQYEENMEKAERILERVERIQESNPITSTGKAKVILFKPSGKYYTEEEWAIPFNAIGPYDMVRSPNFRRISGGAVLVDTQEPWGYPHLFPNRELTEDLED